jgi:ATP-binding protein involved in chromosome partitioning
MKLDRKEILKALEAITVAGEGKNMIESGAVRNVLTLLRWKCLTKLLIP